MINPCVEAGARLGLSAIGRLIWKGRWFGDTAPKRHSWPSTFRTMPVDRKNNRVENYHVVVRRRKRKMQGFKPAGPVQRILPASSSAYNAFTLRPRLISHRAPRLPRAEATYQGHLATLDA
jgi:transposase-like protein